MLTAPSRPYAEKEENNKVVDYLDVYDDTMVRRYKIPSPTSSTGWTLIEGTERPHGFDRVPIIEYRNNTDAMGDFECILDLQDAVNELLSDRIKDKTRFANARSSPRVCPSATRMRRSRTPLPRSSSSNT